jgi:hypothetical protein
MDKAGSNWGICYKGIPDSYKGILNSYIGA